MVEFRTGLRSKGSGTGHAGATEAVLTRLAGQLRGPTGRGVVPWNQALGAWSPGTTTLRRMDNERTIEVDLGAVNEIAYRFGVPL